MKQLLVNKFSENTFHRVYFYVVSIYGIVASILLMAEIEKYQQAEWYTQVMVVLCMSVLPYMAIDLLWLFGDHPEEDGEE